MLTQSKGANEWKKASYLNERLQSGNEKGSGPDRYGKWMEAGGFNESSLMLKLAPLNLDREMFKQLLSEKDEPSLIGEPKWIIKLEQILQCDWNEEIGSNEINYDIYQNSFFPFFVPFLQYAKARLTAGLEELDSSVGAEESLFGKTLLPSMLRTLHKHLQMLSVRTLISELHIAKWGGELNGNTPEDRYCHFEATLDDPAKRRELLEIYPVLGRLMTEAVMRNLTVNLEALTRFTKDLPAIRMAFNHGKDKLAALHADAGDSHKDGRTVMIFEFESGFKLVYKPRSMDLDRHFNQFLLWVEERGYSLPLKAPLLLDRSGYGWQEYIAYRECLTEEELKRFYYRQGGYIALLYFFRSSDFHFENIIASGEYPVLIDLETLFSNHLDLFKESRVLTNTSIELHESVFGSLMLPVRFSRDMPIDLDMSALGGEGGQESRKITTWGITGFGTDDMQLVQYPVIMEGRQNLPLKDGKKASATDYIDDISSGFQEMYELFMANQLELLSDSGPIAVFREDHVRHVIRPTRNYTRFLTAGTHPDFLQNGLDREQLFDHFWLATKRVDKFADFIRFECEDLMKQDVPYFSFQFGGTSLFDSRGSEIDSFYSQSSMDLVFDRVKNLSENDCSKQMRYIRMSVMTLLKKPESHKPMGTAYLNEEHPVPQADEFLKAAAEIGDELVQTAFYDEENHEAVWIGLSLDQHGGLICSPLGPGLYDGTLGIILFLAQLSEETGNPVYRHYAEAGLAGVTKVISESAEPLSISAYHGYASVQYTLASLGVIWKDQGLIDRAYSYHTKIKELAEKNETADFLGGTAGALLATLQMYRLTSQKEALDTAEYLGECLVPYVKEKLEEGMWTGLSHGASGYAWPLLELFKETGNRTYYELAESLIDFEQANFLPSEQNWKDLRGQEGKTQPVFWCHGAPGIGLARKKMLEGLESGTLNEKLSEDLTAAIDKTRFAGFGVSHSLCHGDFGNLDILLSAAGGDVSGWRKIGKSSLDFGKQTGWSYGLHEKAELLGLMLGLAGIGYGLLRLWNPLLPSVLALEWPDGKVM